MNFTPDCKFFCYIIYSNNRTYNGYTVNLERRLKQHNGELKGGAKSTKGHQWKYLAIVSDPKWTKQDAMKFEWLMRYPTRKVPRPKEYCGVDGRLLSLDLIKKEEMQIYITLQKDILPP
jgi:predicted GIY-YIG superfamily endonuclease